MRSALFLAMLAMPVAAHAQSFHNGSFETYQGQPGGDNVRTGLSEGDTSVDGWINSGGFQIYEDAQDGLVAQDGTHYISFGHNGTSGGTLSQTFSTVAGLLYTVNYYYAAQQGDGPLQQFSVSVDGGTPVYALAPINNVWTAGTPLAFIGSGSPTTLTFTDSSPAGAGDGSNLALDNVTVTATDAPVAAVPEAASWIMMIGGLGLIGWALRRRGAAGGRPSAFRSA